MITETKETISKQGIQNIIDIYYKKYPIEAYGTTHTQPWYDDAKRKWVVKFNRLKTSD